MRDIINNKIFKTYLAMGLSLFSWGMSLAACILVLTNGLFYANGSDYLLEIVFIFLAIIAGFKAKSGGIAASLFLLPLLPGLNSQLAAISGLSILNKSFNGLDLISGFFLGAVLQSLLQPKSELRKILPPWEFGLLTLMLILSTCIGITRNLWQSASVYSLEGLIYNLFRFNQQGWHEDYRPLTELVSYLIAIAWLSILIPLLKTIENRTQKVYRPIIAGLIVSGLFGLIQVATGWGVPGDRSDRVLSIAAKGFEPDIHAYAGHMLLGALGLIGYFLFETKNRLEKNLVGFTVAIAWLGLISSKSRSSLLIALAVMLPICSIWLWRKNKKIYLILLTILIMVGGTAVYLRYFYNHPQWFLEYLRNLAQYEVFNRAFGQRADMYIAAVRMFYAFPLLGLGLGDYYRMSADIGFSHSSIYSFLKGENAHNYFLQTLVETGIFGSLVFIYVLIKPLLTSENRKQKKIAYIGFAGLCAGNIFAHSFLVRENLFLGLSLIALAYAWEQERIKSSIERETQKVKKGLVFERRLIGTIIIVTIILSVKELTESFIKYPYIYGSVCYEPRPKSEDNWLSGVFHTNAPIGSTGIIINIAEQRLNTKGKTLNLKITAKNSKLGISESKNYELIELGSKKVKFNFPLQILSGEEIDIEIRVSQCFTPKNFGHSMDARRLGIKIEMPGIEFY